MLFFQPTLTKVFPSLLGWDEFQANSKAIFPTLKKYIDAHKETYEENNIRDVIDFYLKKMYSTSNKGSSFYKDEGGKK